MKLGKLKTEKLNIAMRPSAMIDFALISPVENLVIYLKVFENHLVRRVLSISMGRFIGFRKNPNFIALSMNGAAIQ